MKYYQNHYGGYIGETWCFTDYSDRPELFTFRDSVIYNCYGEKLPVDWGVPQQTTRPEKSIPPQYARETKHLTLKDLESYLISDG